jgi:hypothetical protein
LLYVTILRSDRARDPELWATIWQGKAPPTLKLRAVYNLLTDTRVFVWEGETIADARFIDRLNQVGETTTSPALDQTTGWQHAFAGDVEAMRSWFEQRGLPAAQIDAAIDLRRRGHEAPNLEAARRAAIEWQEEQAGQR